jgi:hypothetical protein
VAVAAIPVLSNQAAYQHTARIYLDWSLVRANPMFVVLGGLWVGLSLTLLRAIDRRGLFMLALIGFWTCATLLRDRGAASRLGLDVAHVACWAPIPVLPATLVSMLWWRLGRGPLEAAAVGGAVFGLACQLVWPTVGPLVGALIAAPFAALGVAAGTQIVGTLLRPNARGCIALAAVALSAPFASGAVDLYLRLRTPWA